MLVPRHTKVGGGAWQGPQAAATAASAAAPGRVDEHAGLQPAAQRHEVAIKQAPLRTYCGLLSISLEQIRCLWLEGKEPGPSDMQARAMYCCKRDLRSSESMGELSRGVW